MIENPPLNIVIATIKSWNINNAKQLIQTSDLNITLISEKEEFTNEVLNKIDPDIIFIPHWSWIIPKSIVDKYTCILFHMTDLPYGRGGSPLQNLIVRGKTETKISAIRLVEELDAGPVYYKENLSLEGTAEEIFIRQSSIVFNKMIPKILNLSTNPVEQKGDVVKFKRRKPSESNLSDVEFEDIYNYIRMLDCEGYPNAFLKSDKALFEFNDVEKTEFGYVAQVLIKPKDG